MKPASQPLVILAGGQSARMGREKALIDIQGTRLVDLVVKQVSNQVGQLFISGPDSFGLVIEIIPDQVTGPNGPAAALFAVFKHLDADPLVQGFFTVPVDAPNLPSDLCERLHDLESSTFASDGMRTHPTFAWWRIHDLRKVFTKWEKGQNLSLHKVSQIVGAKTVEWSDSNLFFNINSPNDVTEYLTQK